MQLNASIVIGIVIIAILFLNLFSPISHSSIPPIQPVSDEIFYKFLNSEDIEMTLQFAKKMQRLSKSQQNLIRQKISENWNENFVSISNLLFHLRLIPNDILYETVMKALKSNESYFVTAVSIGLQNYWSLFSEKQKMEIKQLLLNIVSLKKGIEASRALIALTSVLSLDDSEKVFLFLEKDDQSVIHNARAWLLNAMRHLPEKEISKMIEKFRVNESTKKEFLEINQKFRKNLKEKKSFPLADYFYPKIPNYSDIKFEKTVNERLGLIFSALDEKGKGFLSLDQISDFLIASNTKLSLDEIKERVLKINKNGNLNMEEFIHFMKMIG